MNSRAGSLPQAITSFIGREAEREALVARLRQSRMVTITGVGGVGKTRLAVEVARAERPAAADVWFVDFSAVTDPAAVVPHVARTVAAHESGERAIEDTLISVLCVRSGLVILDNCEHVLGAAAQVVDMLLRGCPSLTVLATSREPLGVDGEVVWRLQPLPSEGADSDALRLFVERVGGPDARELSSPDDASAAVRLCQVLEGIPLAIELAAAQVNAIPVRDLVARLEQSVKLLGSETRPAPPRHQTLWSTMAWSYGLLPDDERTLLRRLAVFAGGWTPESAEAVCADDALTAEAIPVTLVRLVNKSLVAPVAGKGVRYRLLEPVRQYAAEELESSGEAGPITTRHCAYFSEMAEAAEQLLRGPRQIEAIERVEMEHDNIRAALARSLRSGCGGEYAVRIVGALGRFWLIRGYFREAIAWAEEALPHAREPRARARLLRAAGMAAYGLGESDAAIRYMRQSVDEERATGDDLAIAEAFCWLGTAYESAGMWTEARAAAAEAETLAPDEHPWLAAHRLRVLAHAEKFASGDLVRVNEIHEREYEHARAAGDGVLIANVLNCLGEFARWSRDFPRARVIHGESLARRTALGDRVGVVLSLTNLGLLEIQAGDPEAARAHVIEAFDRSVALGVHRYSDAILVGLAGIAESRGQFALAGRLLGCANARGASTLMLDPPDQMVYEQVKARCDERYGATACALEMERGSVTSLDAAIAEARSFVESIRQLDVAPASVASSRLTEREAEIIGLVASGLSNRAIADKLVLSVRTVETHIAHAYAKIGVRTRSQATAWAIETGLARTEERLVSAG